RYQAAISSAVLPAAGWLRSKSSETMNSTANARPATPAARGVRRSRLTVSSALPASGGLMRSAAPSGRRDGAFADIGRRRRLFLGGLRLERDHDRADQREGEADDGEDDVPGGPAEPLVEEEDPDRDADDGVRDRDGCNRGREAPGSEGD